MVLQNIKMNLMKRNWYDFQNNVFGLSVNFQNCLNIKGGFTSNYGYVWEGIFIIMVYFRDIMESDCQELIRIINFFPQLVFRIFQNLQFI